MSFSDDSGSLAKGIRRLDGGGTVRFTALPVDQVLMARLSSRRAERLQNAIVHPPSPILTSSALQPARSLSGLRGVHLTRTITREKYRRETPPSSRHVRGA